MANLTTQMLVKMSLLITNKGFLEFIVRLDQDLHTVTAWQATDSRSRVFEWAWQVIVWSLTSKFTDWNALENFTFQNKHSFPWHLTLCNVIFIYHTLKVTSHGIAEFKNELGEWKATRYMCQITISHIYMKEFEAWLIANLPPQMLFSNLLIIHKENTKEVKV